MLFGYGVSIFNGGTGKSNSVVLSSSASNVDGLFHVTVTFSEAVTGLSTSDFSVTNGTAEYLITESSSVYTLFVTPSSAGDVTISLPSNSVTPSNSTSNTLTVTINSSWAFITKTSTANLYYDFRELVGLSSDVVTTQDPATKDLSLNGINLTPVNSPTISNASSAGLVRAIDTSSRSYNTGVTGSTFLNTDFSVNFRIRANDGQPSSVWYICGNSSPTGNIGLKISVQTNGKLKIEYQSTAAGFVWDSTSAVFADGSTSDSYFDIHFDFTTDVLTVNQDGSAVAGSFTTGNISTTNPASYACTANLYLNTFNNNGTLSSDGSNIQHLYYFTITKLQGSSASGIRSYLEAKKPVLELVSTLSDATYLKNPHDVIIDTAGSKAYVSSKGSPTLTSVDGSFAIVDITNPASPSITGGYAGGGDQKDGETVLQLSSSRVLHFVDTKVHLFNVSNPASPTIVKTVSHTTGGTPDVVNGAVKIGNYVFGANKSGYITVLDVSDIDNFTLVGNKDMNALNSFNGPHDIDVCSDNEHIIFVSRRTGAETNNQVGIVKVMNNGSLITLASWSMVATINSTTTPDLSSANRIRVIGNTAIIHTLDSTGKQIATYDISTLASPVYKGQFLLTSNSAQQSSAGACTYRNKYTIAANGTGIRILDCTTDPTSIVQKAGYFNELDFTTTGTTNSHDIEWFRVSGQNYCIVTYQNNTKIGIFKINRI